MVKSIMCNFCYAVYRFKQIEHSLSFKTDYHLSLKCYNKSFIKFKGW